MTKRRYRVLLVEDDLIDQMAFKRAAKAGHFQFDFEIAGSVREAQELLDTGTFHLVITDYHLGDGTAFDLIADGLEIPIIFVTGGGDEELAVNVMKAGAHDYLIKDSEHNYLRLLPITVANALNLHESKINLRRSETRYRDLFEGTTDLIQSVNENGQLMHVNRAWRNALGYSELEIPKLHLFDIIHEDYRAHCEGILEKLMHDGGTQNMEVKFVTKDQRILHVRGNAVVIEEDGVRTTRSIFHDVTAQVEAEENLKAYNERLEQKVEQRTQELANINLELRKEIEDRILTEEELKQINDELSTFIYKISHDIRGPLTSVLGLVNLARIDTHDENSIIKYCDLIEERLLHLDIILGKLTNVSRIRQGRLEMSEVNFDAIIKEILTSIEHVPNFGAIDIHYSVQLENAFRSDRSILLTILQNLILNAVKYQKPKEEHPYLDLKVYTKGANLMIEAKDNGIGLSQEVKEKVFEMFYRGTRESDGSGLGLYLVRKGVRRLQGEVIVESELGVGSVFTIRLPVPKQQEVTQSNVEPVRE